MALNDYQRVLRSSRFHELVQQRTGFAWTLSIAMTAMAFVQLRDMQARGARIRRGRSIHQQPPFGA